MRRAPSVRFNSLEIFFTDNFSREYCFKDRKSFFVFPLLPSALRFLCHNHTFEFRHFMVGCTATGGDHAPSRYWRALPSHSTASEMSSSLKSSYLGPINPTSGTVSLIYVLLDEVEDWCHTVHFQGPYPFAFSSGLHPAQARLFPACGWRPARTRVRRRPCKEEARHRCRAPPWGLVGWSLNTQPPSQALPQGL